MEESASMFFFQALSEILVLTESHRQQDSYEWFQFLINALHDTSGCERPADPKVCNCIYHQSFFGMLRSTVACLQCKNVTVAGEPFIDLSVDILGQVKRRKLAEPKRQAEVEEKLDLGTCLTQYTSVEELAEDGYTCPSEECGSANRKARK